MVTSRLVNWPFYFIISQISRDGEDEEFSKDKMEQIKYSVESFNNIMNKAENRISELDYIFSTMGKQSKKLEVELDPAKKVLKGLRDTIKRLL